ncbi:hypothetical protein QP866_06475 [Corynebacterium imitans]|uniref:hypothetical protein n=1 Tax=Corynebacterium imitans TaxID=156978 RepID=UPI00254FDA98|nr:hypothetical protein [Corynebacterium imitans]MDK8306502.1 hypothetical protein [Corynebacterium imitans]MDK8637471.1 hypothetical protein [Corynebacterium imitans]MDK8772630.1 hypothetical protein [Corynebacterium imitans]
MKRLARACTAAAMGVALVLGGQPVVAHAAAQTSKVELDASRQAQLTYKDEDSVAGKFSSTLYTDIMVEGARSMAPANTVAEDTAVEYDDPERQVRVKREIRTRGNVVDVEVTVTNTGAQERYLQVDLTNSINTDRPLTGAFADGRFTVGPEFGGYDTVLEFPGARYSGVGPSFNDTTASRELGSVDKNGAQFQHGRWFDQVGPGNSLRAHATLTFETQESAKDSDRDGLPDLWEEQGVTLDDGTRLPLNEWGADPHRPDIFLQMNWMRSEYETLGCFENPGKTECADAKTTSYRPSRTSFDELVERFAARDIALHIDAGEYYSNIPNYGTRHGGETENYEEYYFRSTIPGLRMVSNVNRLLGQRSAVFHSGVVGGMMNPGNYSVGVSLVGDNGFYVAKHERMTKESQLRNTIMHELGHNLGLNHNGATKFKDQVPKSDYLPNYKSVMNYLYQFSYFDYSDEEAVSGGPLPQECNRAGVDCYTGDYRIPADWDNLTINSARLGRPVGTAGAEAEKVDVRALEKLDREIAQAESENGNIDVEIVDEGDLTAGKEGTVTLELHNPGLDLGRFDVIVGETKTQVVVGGVRTGHNTATVRVPVSPEAQGSLPLDVMVRSERGVTAFEDRLAVPVRAGEAPASTAMQGADRRKATPTPPTTAVQAPSEKHPQPEKTSSAAAIAVPIVLLLALIGGAAFAWANDLI